MVTPVLFGNVLQPPDVERQQFSTFHAEVQSPVLPGARPRLFPVHSKYVVHARGRGPGSVGRDLRQDLLQLLLQS